MPVFLQYKLLDIRIQYCLINSICDRSTPFYRNRQPFFELISGKFVLLLGRIGRDRKNDRQKKLLASEILKFLYYIEKSRKENPRPFSKGRESMMLRFSYENVGIRSVCEYKYLFFGDSKSQRLHQYA